MIQLAAIIAISKNGCIGKDGTIPWSLPNDMKHFRKVTYGHTVVMGRRTYESLSKALPGRQNIVLTRDKDFQPKDAIVIHDAMDIFRLQNLKSNKVFVIGGSKVYSTYFKQIREWYVSRLVYDVQGDTYFDYDWNEWADQVEVLYSDEDFSVFHYVKDSYVGNYNLYNHSLFLHEESEIYKGLHNHDSVFSKIIEQDTIYGQGFGIICALHANGNISFSAMPYMATRGEYMQNETHYYDIVRPKSVMKYTDEEVKDAYNSIRQYLHNLFDPIDIPSNKDFTVGEVMWFLKMRETEQLVMNDNLADVIYDFMEKQVNSMSKEFTRGYNIPMTIGYIDRLEFVRYSYDIQHLIGLDINDEDSKVEIYAAKDVADFIVNIITESVSDWLDEYQKWDNYNITGNKTYKSMDYIRRLSNKSLSHVRFLVKETLAALTYGFECDMNKKQWFDWYQKNYIIEKVIVRLFEIRKQKLLEQD